MKVYACPGSISFAAVDSARSVEQVEAAEKAYQDELCKHLRSMGYTGPRTGEVVRFHVADGYAEYLYADAGESSVLLHLPYLDGYSYPDVEFLPREEILRRIDAEKRLQAMLAARQAQA